VIIRAVDALEAEQAARVEAAEAEAESCRLEAERLRGELHDLAVRLDTAERMRERFRYALFVYLQERDGPAGRAAPTPETLALIRDLIGSNSGG